MSASLHVVIVTGMSGAGRSRAAKALEDLGYFVVDNIPPTVVGQVVDHAAGEGLRSRIAIVLDSRGGLTYEDLEHVLRGLHGRGFTTTVLYLDARGRGP